MNVEKIGFEPKYKRENGLFVIDPDAVNLPFEVKEKSLVYIPPEAKGGNHKHPRIEAFVGIGEGLVVTWIDDEGRKHEEKMNENGNLAIFVMPANIPHVVVNTSRSQFGVLFEYANESQHDVEIVELA